MTWVWTSVFSGVGFQLVADLIWRCDLQVVTEGTAQGNLAIVSKQLSLVKCWMWDDIAAKMTTLVLLEVVKLLFLSQDDVSCSHYLGCQPKFRFLIAVRRFVIVIVILY